NYNYNVIYWDKTGYSHVDSFIVYRKDNFSINYLRIGAVSKDSLSEFIDKDSTIGGPHGGNPTYNSWKYKLAIKDTCGNISSLSPYHQTMFVQENLSNFSWTAYVDSGQASLPTGYSLLRDDNNTGVWNVLSNPGSTSTTDPSYASYPSGNWRVDALGFGDCTPTLRLAGGNNNPYTIRVRSHSNTQRQAGHTSDINKLVSGNEVSIYPNPAKDVLNIECLMVSANNTLVITDMLGNAIYHATFTTQHNTIDVSDLQSGMYFIEVGGIRKTIAIAK
ncbi:MAG TPA: T9SS type A sorting domain-containing protein, partial [Bacteroidia bacterium]